MPTNYGIRTHSQLDVRLSRISDVVRHLDANGVTFTGANTVRVLNYDIDSSDLDDYDEGAVSQSGTVLAEFGKQEMTLAYNKFKFVRLQQTQEQDVPVASLASKIAKTWVDEKFIPDFDEYALNVIYAARPNGNAIQWDGVTETAIKEKFFNTISTIKEGNGTVGNVIAWTPYRFADKLKAHITSFDGSDLGYTAGKNGVLGPLDGAMVVQTKNSYFSAFPTVDVIAADKRAIVAPLAKQDPKTNGFKLIREVPGHGGSELQLRGRGDVFVFDRKKDAIATLGRAGS